MGKRIPCGGTLCCGARACFMTRLVSLAVGATPLMPRNELDAKGKAERKRFLNTRSVDEKRVRKYDQEPAGWESGPD